MNKYDWQMIWWNWFLANPTYWAHGFTIKKLKKLEQTIFSINHLWDNLKLHFSRSDYPWNAMNNDEYNYKHAIGNFSGIIAEIAIRNGLINRNE